MGSVGLFKSPEDFFLLFKTEALRVRDDFIEFSMSFRISISKFGQRLFFKKPFKK